MSRLLSEPTCSQTRQAPGRDNNMCVCVFKGLDDIYMETALGCLLMTALACKLAAVQKRVCFFCFVFLCLVNSPHCNTSDPAAHSVRNRDAFVCIRRGFSRSAGLLHLLKYT